MGFETLNLNDIPQGTGGTAKPLPIGEYTLQLLSAKPDTYDENKIAFDIAVADGNYAKRRVFPTLPSPKGTDDWSARAAALFMRVLGIEQNPGETVLDMFNRAAANGNSKFVGQTKQYTNGKGEVKPDLNWFSLKPYVG